MMGLFLCRCITADIANQPAALRSLQFLGVQEEITYCLFLSIGMNKDSVNNNVSTAQLE
jgi:hypothetical protein